MKKSTLKSLLVASMALMSSAAFAQTLHPLAFPRTTATGPDNFYANYVGLRFEVTAPTSIAGDKTYTTANDGTGATGHWGGAITTPIVNQPVVMGPTADTIGCAAFAGGSMAGKIALIYRGTCEFGFKALQAQNAGAIACVIVNNIPGGPVGMAAGASGLTVIIPVFMISNADGMAITNQINAGVPVTLTLTKWGFGNTNDLGFVTGGTSNWHSYAIPSNQLSGSTSPAAYIGVDGAFVANYGTSTQTNVKLTSTVQFTPTGGTATTVHADSITLASFPAIDSIWSLYPTSLYNVNVTGNGRFDINYNISSDIADDYIGDNSYTYSFYTTDSLYSKGRYDFTNNVPFVNTYLQPGVPSGGSAEPYIWGPMYYVANGGARVKDVQFTVAAADTGFITSIESMSVYLFQWIDGSGGNPADSIVQNGELQLAGTAIKVFDPAVDKSEDMFTVPTIYDSNGVLTDVYLVSNSWYFLGAEVPATWFMGLDGILDAYPRTYGRFNNAASYLEYAGPLWGGDRASSTDNMELYPNAAIGVCPFAGTTYVNSIDSANYNNQKGAIPQVAMRVNNHATAVKNVGAPIATVQLFPNPATDHLTITAAFATTAKSVVYTIIDGMGRFVSKETHNNVLNDKYTLSTANFASGTYFVSIVADGKAMSRKFTVIK